MHEKHLQEQELQHQVDNYKQDLQKQLYSER